MREILEGKSDEQIHREHVEAHMAVGAEIQTLTPTPALRAQARVFAMEGANLWEETLKLTIQEKPWWCPLFVYSAAVRLIIRQEKDRKVFHENWTRRRRFKLFRPAKGSSHAPSLGVIFPPK